MKVKIYRVDKNLPLPSYETRGAKGFDIMARGDHEIAPKEILLIPSNLIIEVPENYMLAIASRSSTPLKKGLTPPHGFGVIDSDFCGDKDEILIQVYNFLDKPVFIKNGEKIAQGVFVRVDNAVWDENEEHWGAETRGGFGSTDGYLDKSLQ